MSLEGRLEDLSLPDIFQIVSLSNRSGILVMIRKEGTGRVVFNRGHVLYASADNKSRLGYTLVRKGIIANEDLEKALHTQKIEGFKKPLGTIMVAMGILSPEVLEEEIRRHIIEVIHGLLKWEAGSFHFELSAPSEEDVVLESGLSTEFLLLEATRLQDEDEHHREETRSREIVARKPIPVLMGGQRDTKGVRKDHPLLTLMIKELSESSASSEIALLILRFASEIMNRAVIFLVRGQDILGLGQSGVVLPGGGNANERVRDICMPLAEESIFKSVMEKRVSYKGKLAESRWNLFLVERLGKGWPTEVYAAPLINDDRIVAILYCDNLPTQEAIGETEGLEAFIKVAGFAFGRALPGGRPQRPE